MSRTTGDGAPRRRYNAIVFKHAPPTGDFTCSEQVVLPGEHTEQEAWAVVRGAMRADGYIGGEVRAIPCAGQ